MSVRNRGPEKRRNGGWRETAPFGFHFPFTSLHAVGGSPKGASRRVATRRENVENEMQTVATRSDHRATGPQMMNEMKNEVGRLLPVSLSSCPRLSLHYPPPSPYPPEAPRAKGGGNERRERATDRSEGGMNGGGTERGSGSFVTSLLSSCRSASLSRTILFPYVRRPTGLLMNASRKKRKGIVRRGE